MTWPKSVRKSDLRIEYYRGSGPGGQHRNKKDTACRITHKETGLSASAEDSASQDQNRKAAFKRLTEQLVPLMKAAAAPELPESPDEEVIRTYHKPRQQVKDYRISDRTWSYRDVLDGKALEEIIEANLQNRLTNE